MPTEKDPDTIKPAVQPVEIATAISTPAPDPLMVEYFDSHKIPYCKNCGQQIRSNDQGDPFCPYVDKSCPVAKP